MRRFLLISSLIAAGATASFASVDSGLLALVPAGARIVSGIDFTRSRGSEFGQYLLNRSQSEDAHFQEMIQETGFDPRRDLQSVVFESAGPVEGSKQSSFAILARGTFDEERIKATAKSKGAVIQVFQGVELMVSKSPSEQTAIAFPGDGVAVMADLATLQQMVTNRATPTVLDPALQSKIDAVGSQNDAWFVSLTGGGFLARHIRQETGQDGEKQPMQQQAHALEAVTQSSGGIRLGAVNEITFDAITRSPQDATSLSDVVRFVASMVQMQRDSDTRAGIVASSLDGMQLQTTGNAIHLTISMPEKSLEQLADLGPRAAHAKPNRQ
jgi:hypothetical protein